MSLINHPRPEYAMETQPPQSATAGDMALQPKEGQSQANILANRQRRPLHGGPLVPLKSQTTDEERRDEPNSNSDRPSESLTSELKAGCTDNSAEETGNEPRLCLSKNKTMLVFNRPIDQAYTARFFAIQGSVELLLVKYTSKKSLLRRAACPKPMAVRLMTLGETARSAKPHIVVFCAPEIRKRVQHFFDTDVLVRELYKPEDASVPTFDVIVYGCEPRLRNEAAVSVVWETVLDPLLGVCIEPGFSDTYCGTPVQFQANGSCRNATIGGVIKITDRFGNMSFWGITAGHAARACLANDNIRPEETGLSAEGDEEEDYDKDCELSDDDPEESVTDSGQTIWPGEGMDDIDDTWNFKQPMAFGDAVLSSLRRSEPGAMHGVKSKGYFDWALLPIPGASLNLLPESVTSSSEVIIKQIYPETPAHNVSDSAVFVLRAGNGLQSGHLLPQPSRVRINPGDEFVDVYVVTLDGPHGMTITPQTPAMTVCLTGTKAEFKDGDSGAWVILATTYELLGHVVATDCFGAAYVMPASAVLRDIQEEQNATDVSLPTLDDGLAMKSGRSLTQRRSSDRVAITPSFLTADRFTTRLSHEREPSTYQAKPTSDHFRNTTSITLENIPASILTIFRAKLSQMDGYKSYIYERDVNYCWIRAEFEDYWTASSAIHQATLLAQSRCLSGFTAFFSRSRKNRDQEAEATLGEINVNHSQQPGAWNQGIRPYSSVLVGGSKEPPNREPKQPLHSLHTLYSDENDPSPPSILLAKEEEERAYATDADMDYSDYQLLPRI
ncbi:hypothetical protein K4F52_001113 [Lecanicillium sp. MT-2017a]|nr:hypothetical protein K4F52_001113 [Lecanicillium sp. MT-2017a]